MANESPAVPPRPAPGPLTAALRRVARAAGEFWALRRPAPLWQEVLLGLLCLAACFGLWWYVTAGAPEERILPPAKGLYSPAETFASLGSLWFERELTRNTLATLKRVALGFGLAALVGIPLGVLCGCFPRVQAFFVPLMIFGRNIPVAALIPLTFALFDIGEQQKVMFIFIACVAFVVADTARAVMEVAGAYIDTAYTLGASRRQVILKVVVPLAMPSVFNSLRLLFGLAFGYIMLTEIVKLPDVLGGLGYLINLSQRRNEYREHIFLILLLITVVAVVIDRLLFWIQRELFPYRYGGTGLLNQALAALVHAWDDLKSWLWKRSLPSHLALPQQRPTPVGKP